MKALKIIFGLSLLFVLSTCTKFGKNVTVKGRVLNPLTGEGIPDVDVVLIRNTLGLPGGTKIIKSVTTDANGNFELSKFTLSQPVIAVDTKGVYYRIGWLRGDTYSTFHEFPVKIGKTMKMEYHAVPYGKYQLKVNNINCEGGGDTLILNQTNQIGSLLGIDWLVLGCNGYLSSIEKVPMGNIYTKYTVIRNGISYTNTVDFYVQPNQDNIQEINY